VNFRPSARTWAIIGVVMAVVVVLGFRLASSFASGGSADGSAHDDHAAAVEGDHEEVMLYKLEGVAEGAISTALIREGSLDETIQVSGEVIPHPNNAASVSSLVTGRVSRLLVGVGDYVEAGATLALVESAEAAQAYAAYEEAKSRLALAEQDLRTTEALARAGVYTGKPVDEVRRERAAVASELAELRAEQEGDRSEAEAGVRAAEAALERAKSARDFAAAELKRETGLAQAGAIGHPPLDAARNEAADARADLATAHAARAAAGSELRRVEGLVKLGTASQRELDLARQADAEAQASVERAEAQVEIANRVLAREQKLLDEGVYASRATHGAETELAKAERDVQAQQAALDQAMSRLRTVTSAEKKAALSQTEARLAALDSMLDREKLVAREKLMVQEAVAQRKAAIARARVDLEAARRAVRLYKARPSGSGSISIPVVTPISGTVTTRPVKMGQTVHAGTDLFTVLDGSTLWVEMDVYEKHLPRIRVGQTVRLTSEDVRGWEHTTTVHHVAEELDKEKRTAKVRAELTDPSMRPGMFVKAELSVREGPSGLIVPIDALADEPTGHAVYIEWPDGQGWERHAVEVVARNAREALIIGPAAGEHVATKGLTLVQAAVKAQMAGGEGVAAGHGHEH